MKKLFAILLMLSLLATTAGAIDSDCTHIMSIPVLTDSWYEDTNLMFNGCIRLVSEYYSYCGSCGYEHYDYISEELSHQIYWYSETNGVCSRCGTEFGRTRSLAATCVE